MAAPATWAGALNTNTIQNALFNMIISQDVRDPKIQQAKLWLKGSVDGSMYGDQKLFYAVKPLETVAWGNDAEATNLLALARPAAPHVTAITLNIFRQTKVTTDNYLSKQAFGTEGAFAAYNAIVNGLLNTTKDIHMGALYNVFCGTEVTTEGNQSQTVTLTGTNDAQNIMEKVANIITEMGDYNYNYNDLGYLRAYAEPKLIFNAKYINQLTYKDTPTVYHREALMKMLDGADVLPAKYFGYTPVAGTDVDSSTYKAASGKVIRSRKEVTVGSTHYFPGDQFEADTTFGTNKNVALADAYVEDDTVICKIYTDLPKVMTGFSVMTDFNNPRSLTDTKFLTFGYNTLKRLPDEAWITLKKTTA